ncbi:nitrous oxide-stimulated promoter family protein [Murimonas intestini]|uniref:YbgA-like uncharacterized protein n=1 Tax=Murimonas intestini TaxID=1337051 RepID=A0AB73T424_9FIRM|nr:nitrous oxide-stimulated promoter family protein [Murimonas intestini]MCR1841018.1 nitrous oxide-stimulated promoter family protein [Murimonas intestini]MCR1865864.1 nitrous oxide-stimulated promoter family protein [Murimonas intestini]MCR1883284.1 nitrous oxide-stimulated promoter family protein [Murimonas intestini]
MKKDMQTGTKREKEKEILELMVKICCSGNRHEKASGEELCPECRELLSYAKRRVDACRFMETKTFCSNCKVHCYKKDMRERIKSVMRYSGPRMIMYHPVLAVRHLIESKKEKKG